MILHLVVQAVCFAVLVAIPFLMKLRALHVPLANMAQGLGKPAQQHAPRVLLARTLQEELRHARSAAWVRTLL